jgi:hypothetical protein
MADKIDALGYMECSALTGQGIRSILERATREAMNASTESKHPSRPAKCVVA